MGLKESRWKRGRQTGTGTQTTDKQKYLRQRKIKSTLHVISHCPEFIYNMLM